MSYREVMGMPIRTFWLFSGNIRRVRAENDVRDLMIASASQSAEGVNALQERLVLEIGTVMTNMPALDIERDEEGFNELKMMAQAM
jgi:hypothetical protein